MDFMDLKKKRGEVPEMKECMWTCSKSVCMHACMKFLTNTQPTIKRHGLMAACPHLVNQIIYMSRDLAYDHQLDFGCV